MELSTQYVLFGLWFGYPSCCVRAFSRMEGWCETEQIPEEFVGTGFRPCQNCVETMPATVLLDHINRTRICPLPFDAGINLTARQLAGKSAKSSQGFHQWVNSLPVPYGCGANEVARMRLGHWSHSLTLRPKTWQERLEMEIAE